MRWNGYIRNILLLGAAAVLLAGLAACGRGHSAVWAETGYVGIPPVFPPVAEVVEIPAPPPPPPESPSEPEALEDYVYDDAPEPQEEPAFSHWYYTLGRRPKIALTFDDGPVQYTELLLDLLDEHGGRATFCLLGYRVQPWAETVVRIVESGSEAIGHSWNHSNLTQLGADAITRQILDTSAAIEAVTGAPPPPIFRAPYGLVNARVRNTARELGYSVLRWSIDPRDWLHRDADHLHAYIMYAAADGAIVLLHDIHTATIEAMRRVIPELVALGFQLITASEIIDYFYGPLEPGVQYSGLR